MSFASQFFTPGAQAADILSKVNKNFKAVCAIYKLMKTADLLL